MKKEKGDRLYTVMTVLAVLAFRGHYYFLVIDYNLILLTGLACIVCIAILWLIAFYTAKKKVTILYSATTILSAVFQPIK